MTIKNMKKEELPIVDEVAYQTKRMHEVAEKIREGSDTHTVHVDEETMMVSLSPKPETIEALLSETPNSNVVYGTGLIKGSLGKFYGIDIIEEER